MNASTFKLTKSPMSLKSLKSSDRAKFETKTDTVVREGLPDSMILAVISLATVYWVLDSILNIFFSNKFNLIAEHYEQAQNDYTQINIVQVGPDKFGD